MQAIVLAGGFGTRLKSVVADLPKPMAPVNGKPFLEKLLQFWTEQGVSSFILSVHYRWETIRDHFGNSFRGAKVQYAVEASPLGTGGAILNAATFVDQTPYLIVNGDTFFDVDLKAMLAFHREKASDVTIALATVPENTRYGGITTEPDGRILSFAARGPKNNPCINGGIYLVNRSDLGPVRPVSLEKEIFPELIQKGDRFFGFRSPGKFLDIGIPEDYQKAGDFIG